MIWKGKYGRKPLILNGARQVGKTWLLKEFGSREYESLAYINCEEAPEYHIAVAGSLLGIGLHEGTGFPVGKVDEINLYPLSFKEFITALGNKILAEQMGEDRWNELSGLSSLFIELLRQYYYVGGMPAVVRAYAETHDVLPARDIQNQILADYRRDFSKHVPADILPKVNMVWDSVPAQLAKENKKYIYSAIKKGGRAKEFEIAIQWLQDAGLVHKVRRISKLAIPLKLYALEIDFVVQTDGLYPIEVKADENLKSKSLRSAEAVARLTVPC